MRGSAHAEHILAARPPTHSPFFLQGNLCWDAALEVTLAAKSVHAAVMDPAGKELDPECVGSARPCAAVPPVCKLQAARLHAPSIAA